MSSKRKEKKIKGTDTVPLPPPHRNSQFFLHPSEIFQRSKVTSQSIPSEMTFKAPPPPHQKILSVVGIVRGEWEWIFEWNRPHFIYGDYLIVLVSLKKTTATTTTQKIVGA